MGRTCLQCRKLFEFFSAGPMPYLRMASPRWMARPSRSYNLWRGDFFSCSSWGGLVYNVGNFLNFFGWSHALPKDSNSCMGTDHPRVLDSTYTGVDVIFHLWVTPTPNLYNIGFGCKFYFTPENSPNSLSPAHYRIAVGNNTSLHR
jgi:hypothetical protein